MSDAGIIRRGYVYFLNGKSVLWFYFHPKFGEYTIFWRIKQSIRELSKPSPKCVRRPVNGHPVLSNGRRRHFYLLEKLGKFRHEFLVRAYHETCTARPSRNFAAQLIVQAESHLAEFREKE